MPDYFKLRGYECPTDVCDGPFQYAFNTDLTYFEFLHSDPQKVKTFNTFMTGNRSIRKHWTEWFPVRDIVFEGFSRNKSENGVLLVDMGGGQGHDLERFAETFPEANGSLVLQDLPGTISTLKPLKGSITAMSHDLFTPQPVKGMSLYNEL
jgi:hypothetical protein